MVSSYALSVPSLHDAASIVHVRVGRPLVPLCALRLPAARVGASRRFLLLHGNPAHIDHFAANVDFLSQHGEMALYDAPGFGASPAPADALSLDYLSDVAAAYALSVGWSEGVDVIGHSHGGAVAQTLAARFPALVRSLILIGTMGYPAHPSMRLAMLPGAAAVSLGIARRARRFPFGAICRGFAERLAKTSFHPDPIPVGFVDAELSLVVRTPEIQRSTVRANNSDPTRQLAAQADRVRAPMLVIHGRGDRLVPIAYARRLFALLGPQDRRSVMADLDGGHMVHLTRPAAVHGVIEPWLQGLRE